MKNMFALIVLATLISCNRPPDYYTKGIASMNDKKWDKAIDAFVVATEKDGEWNDSAIVKRDVAFKQLMNSGDWKRVFHILEKYRDNEDFFFESTGSIEQLYFGLIREGKADSALRLVEQNKPKLIEYIDTVFINKVISACEDSLFSGKWEGQGSLSEQEIYFKREGNSLHAYSNKSANGWQKDAIIYKDLRYAGGREWKVNPKIFQTNYWGDHSTYYSKKGSIKLLCSDTLLVAYEVLGNERKFAREK